MSYDIAYFKNLVDTHSTWDSIRTYFEQQRLRVIHCGNNLYIIRYDKQNQQGLVSNWVRSVVWDATMNRPVCVAPPKALEDSDLQEAGTYRYEEFLEGVMVNVFVDASGAIQMASRSKLGATGTFYSSRSFQELLLDAFPDGIEGLRASLQGSTFASLLLQHPAHRIVARHTKPNVVLIHRGSVAADGLVTVHEVNEGPLAIPTLTRPEGLTIQQWVMQLAEQKGWQWQGIVLKDGSGGRLRFRSKAYTMVRTLRGDSPRLDVQFLKLREKGMMETYLYYYPEEAHQMRTYEQELRALTEQLYTLYVDTHIKHSNKFGDLPPHWKPHVYSLHSLYLGTLKERGHFIRKQEVIQYVNHLPIPRVLHLRKSILTQPSSSP